MVDIENLPDSPIPLIKKTLQNDTLNNTGNKSVHDVDLSKTEFAPVQNFLSDTPSQVYNDTKYYKTVLTGENQSAQRVHQILSKYLTCQDPKDRAVFRQQIVTSYWELLRGMVGKAADYNLPMPKRMRLKILCLITLSATIIRRV